MQPYLDTFSGRLKRNKFSIHVTAQIHTVRESSLKFPKLQHALFSDTICVEIQNDSHWFYDSVK